MDKITDTLKTFSNFIVPHSQFQDAVDSIFTSIATTQERGTPCCALMTGEAGVGKSSICQRVGQLLGPPEEKLTDEGMLKSMPCLYCSVPARPTIKFLAQEMLEKLGTPTNAVTQALEYRIVQSLISRQVQLAILDEFHNLAKKGAEKTRSDTCDWVKYILNESNVAIFLSGETGYDLIIDAHPQLARRYPYRINLKPLTFSHSTDSEFRKVLSALTGEMIKLGELDNYVYLSDEHLAAALFMCCNGTMDGLRLVLYAAFRKALLRGDHSLVPSDFSSTINSLSIPTRIQPYKNPFLISTDAVYQAISR